MVCKLKRFPIEWKKIFSSYTSTGFISRIYREFKNLNSLYTYLKQAKLSLFSFLFYFSDKIGGQEGRTSPVWQGWFR
jgi:hypothetical protein